MSIGTKMFSVVTTISVMIMLSESVNLDQHETDAETPAGDSPVGQRPPAIIVETKTKRWRPNVCLITSKSAPCDYKVKKPGYYFDPGNNMCVQFDRSKCGRNANSFKTIEECETWCGDDDIIKRRKSIKLIMRK